MGDGLIVHGELGSISVCSYHYNHPPDDAPLMGPVEDCRSSHCQICEDVRTAKELTARIEAAVHKTYPDSVSGIIDSSRTVWVVAERRESMHYASYWESVDTPDGAITEAERLCEFRHYDSRTEALARSAEIYTALPGLAGGLKALRKDETRE